MENRVAIFINPSIPFLLDKAKKTYTNWGFISSNMIRLNEWYNDAPFQGGLFEKSFVLLDLTSENHLKKFKNIFDSDKKNTYFKSNWYGSGVIIITTNNKGNWLTKIAEFSNGTIERPLKIEEVKIELTKELKLSKDNAQLVLDVIGEDFSIYTIVKNTLSNLTEVDLRSLSPEDLLRYLPSKKGAVPPWGFISAVMSLNINKAIDEYKRIKDTTHYLVLTTLLKKKLSDLYKYLVLKENGIKESEMLDILSVKNTYAFIDFRKLKVSSNTVAACINVLLKYEDANKGGMNISRNITDTLFLEMVSKLIINLQENQPISR